MGNVPHAIPDILWTEVVVQKEVKIQTVINIIQQQKNAVNAQQGTTWEPMVYVLRFRRNATHITQPQDIVLHVMVAISFKMEIV